MTIENKVDYQDIFADVKWDLDKAKYLLADLQKYFDCPDLDFPPRENIESIHYEYKHIAVMIGLLDDLVDKLAATVNPFM